MMDTVLFTDHGIVVFAITTSAIALILSVLGLATTRLTRSDIESQFKGLADAKVIRDKPGHRSVIISVKRSTAHQSVATTSQL